MTAMMACVGVQVMQDLNTNNIKIYQFPDPKLDADDDAANRKLRVSYHQVLFPLCVCVCVCSINCATENMYMEFNLVSWLL